MNRIFVIPTWAGHFDKNITFLQTCYRYNVKIPIKFVVSNSEEKLELENKINTLLPVSNNLNIEIIGIDKVIQKFKPEITINDIEEIKTSINRFPNIWNAKHPYQGIKKIYALRYFDYDQAMLLDSECAIVKETNVDDLFDEYFAAPFVFYTPHNEVHQNLRIFTNAAQKCLRWTDLSEVSTKWFFENLYWMVDKKILTSMFETIENNIGTDLYTEFTVNAGEIFEMVTYYSYIYLNNEKYSYRFLNYPEIMKEYLGEGYTEYVSAKTQRLGGLLEFMFENVDSTNYRNILNFVRDYRVRFCRPDFCVNNIYVKAVKESPYLNMILACENSTALCELLAN